MEQAHEFATSWIEVDATALRRNIQQILLMVGPQRELGLVVKGNAYGHGLRQVVSAVSSLDGVKTFFVASLREALMVHEVGVTQHVCALVPADFGFLEQALSRGTQLVCADHFFLARIADAANRCGVRARVHLKIDTGLSRLGVCGVDAALDLAAAVRATPQVELWGVMTHFADTAGSDLSFAAEQYRRFDEVCKHLRKAGHVWHESHAGASGALDLVYSDSLVRVGSLLYGYWKSVDQRARYQKAGWHGDLLPVLTWRSRIFHLKKIKAGCSIGYGGDLVATRDMLLAIVPVGYADGYPRALSNRGMVLIGDQRVPIVGRVSMNAMTIDVSAVYQVKVGDPVILLGPSGGVTADEVAAVAGTVNLDILAGISSEIVRVVTEHV